MIIILLIYLNPINRLEKDGVEATFTSPSPLASREQRRLSEGHVASGSSAFRYGTQSVHMRLKPSTSP